MRLDTPRGSVEIRPVEGHPLLVDIVVIESRVPSASGAPFALDARIYNRRAAIGSLFEKAVRHCIHAYQSSQLAKLPLDQALEFTDTRSASFGRLVHTTERWTY